MHDFFKHKNLTVFHKESQSLNEKNQNSTIFLYLQIRLSYQDLSQQVI